MRVGLLSTIDAPFLGYIIRDLTAEGITVAAVILDSKRQAERDCRIHEERTAGRLPPLPLARFERLHIPYYFVRDHSSRSTAALVRRLSLDLLANAGTPRILSRALLDAPSVGVLNCHPGLLPQFRGCTCVEWAIYLDEPVGNTVHFMDEEIDHGPVVLQEPVAITPGDTYVDIRVKVYEQGNALLAKGVRRVIEESLSPGSLSPQGPGRYFGVISQREMQAVLAKLSRGAYTSGGVGP